MNDKNRTPSTRDAVASIRIRPGMYVGSTDSFGLINYFVCPAALLLPLRPTAVEMKVEDKSFTVQADVAVPIEETATGRLAPFEEVCALPYGHGLEGTILTGLSETLSVEVRQKDRTDTLEFRRGVREFHRGINVGSTEAHTTLRFVPDESIFSVTSISPVVFESYLRRSSYLHRGVRFSLVVGGKTSVFCAERGIVDLFISVSSPYQLLHEPICITGEQDALRLEAVYAFHSWKERSLWCFLNNGRAVEGGTHELGFLDGLLQVCRSLKRPKPAGRVRNGIVGVVSLHYPGAVWEGCIKAKVGNPELREAVCHLLVQQSMEWLRTHPDVAEQLVHIETFQFPEMWGR